MPDVTKRQIQDSMASDDEFETEIRHAGVGVLLPEVDEQDMEYVYPPATWTQTSSAEPPARHAPAGAPYIVRATAYWPDGVDERLTALEKRVSKLEGHT